MGEQEGEGDRGGGGRDSEAGRAIWERWSGSGIFVRNVNLSNMNMNLIHN